MEHTSFDLETNEPIVGTASGSGAPPWEQVAPGRYRPRRIRGHPARHVVSDLLLDVMAQLFVELAIERCPRHKGPQAKPDYVPQPIECHVIPRAW